MEVGEVVRVAPPHSCMGEPVGGAEGEEEPLGNFVAVAPPKIGEGLPLGEGRRVKALVVATEEGVAREDKEVEAVEEVEGVGRVDTEALWELRREAESIPEEDKVVQGEVLGVAVGQKEELPQGEGEGVVVELENNVGVGKEDNEAKRELEGEGETVPVIDLRELGEEEGEVVGL